MQTVEFKHETGKRVTIKTNNCKGTVEGNFSGRYGQVEVFVCYADTSGALHREYIPEDDLE